MIIKNILVLLTNSVKYQFKCLLQFYLKNENSLWRINSNKSKKNQAIKNLFYSNDWPENK